MHFVLVVRVSLCAAACIVSLALSMESTCPPTAREKPVCAPPCAVETRALQMMVVPGIEFFVLFAQHGDALKVHVV